MFKNKDRVAYEIAQINVEIAHNYNKYIVFLDHIL